MKYRILESVVPVRKEPSHRSEQVDELLYGYRFTIHEEKDHWLLIQMVDYEYVGWIPSVVRYEEEDENAGNLILWSLTGRIEIAGQRMTVPAGSLVRSDEIIEGEYVEVPVPERIVDIAFRFLNAPYRWGGKQIFGFDCSGLVQLVFSFKGLWLPRDAWQQAQMGEVIYFSQEAQPGDLAFFENEEHQIVHVGIIVSSNQILHASGQVRVDLWDQEGIIHGDKKTYTHRLKVIKRLI